MLHVVYDIIKHGIYKGRLSSKMAFVQNRQRVLKMRACVLIGIDDQIRRPMWYLNGANATI